MEAAAQATPIPRAKGGEESSSKKGYEYEYDEVTYMHNLYYGQLKFLKTAKDLLNDILDSATNPDIILNTEVKLEGITESLKRWETIQPAISLVEAFDIIKSNIRTHRCVTAVIMFHWQYSSFPRFLICATETSI